MNWEAIGALGEMIAAIAVLVTLFYLGRQVKEAKMAMYRQASQDINLLWNQLHNTAASSPGLAVAIAKVEAGEQLEPHEAIQVRSYYMSTFNAIENLWTQAVAQNQPVEEVWSLFSTLLEFPAFVEHWEAYGFITAEGFQEFVRESRGI